jgi:hypothetical protein
MKTITQLNNQIHIEPVVHFDKESRESYFEMLQQALINFSLVDDGIDELEILLKE